VSRWGVIVVLLCAGVVSGCGGEETSDSGAGDAPAATTASIRVTSTAFTDGASIPVGFTCDGEETSPPLAWTAGDAAEEPAAWALVVDDPDAPGGTFVHWVVLDIPPATRSLAAGVAPPDSTQVTNSAGSAEYAGPCPPSGTHHYRFTVYALPAVTGLTADAGLDDALAKVRSSATATGTLVGLYERGS
jgi:Raf kinase inhibitor-like YbhB/YbcL family protein